MSLPRKVLFLFRTVFTWWYGAGVGTRLFTRMNGIEVGSDSQGNRYFRDARDRRRWVIYNGVSEGTRVPPLWDSWLHHTVAVPPVDAREGGRLPHQPNLSGTPYAYVPQGSLRAASAREPVTSDYEAWKPDARTPDSGDAA